MRRAASSMSAGVSSGLRLKRIAECSTASGTRMACSTGEGKSEPLEHAEPVEQATPARSRFISSRSAFNPGNDTLIVCGMPSSEPLRTTGAAWCRQMSQEARAELADVRVALGPLAAGGIEGASQADRQGDRLRAGPAAVLLMSAPRSRPQLHAAAHQQRADALGSMKLVALIDSVATPRSWKWTAILPAACTASQ